MKRQALAGTLAGRYSRKMYGRQTVGKRCVAGLEEALPPTRVEEVPRAASSHNASTGVGSDDFYPKVP